MASRVFYDDINDKPDRPRLKEKILKAKKRIYNTHHLDETTDHTANWCRLYGRASS